MQVNPYLFYNGNCEAALKYYQKVLGAHIEAITVDTPGSQISPQPAQVEATISGNTIGAPGTAKSGASTGEDIGVNSNGGATVTGAAPLDRPSVEPGEETAEASSRPESTTPNA
jgi:uncharacterized glyoxalase superfamily protein PhnB